MHPLIIGAGLIGYRWNVIEVPMLRAGSVRSGVVAGIMERDSPDPVYIAYTLTLWPHLQVYLEDGRAHIDNNQVENAIRPTAVGKKNWLFIGEAAAGQTSAILFTIIEACRSRRIDPWEYLRDVLTRLPNMTNRQLDEVMPDAWGKAQKADQPSIAPLRTRQSQAAA